MAKPRIFVSSTYYDLKHIRASLELFVESLGYEPVLSEKGDIPYVPDVALDESCYREAGAADIFILIIGGRYGSEASSNQREEVRKQREAYDSITRKEFETAHSRDVPVFVLIESGVNAEYQTYLKNQDNPAIKYAHVDSINVFKFIQFVFSKRRNNPVFTFERSSEIETWLREQWAGLFRELLRTRTQQRQFSDLTEQVGELKAVNGTLKNYLEEVLKNVTPTTSSKLIEDEEKRLKEARRLELLRANQFVSFLRRFSIDIDDIERAISTSATLDKLYENLVTKVPGISETDQSTLRSAILESTAARRDINEARKVLGKPPIIEDATSNILESIDRSFEKIKKKKKLENEDGSS